jgi:hypothetical protein
VGAEGHRGDRGPSRGHRALEGEKWVQSRQKAVERTVGRKGTEGRRGTEGC